MNGTPPPTPAMWRGAAAVGLLLLGIGNGGVAIAQQWVATGVAATVIGTVPLWTILFAALWGQRPTRRELTGVLLGLSGIVILNLGGSLHASPSGAAILLLAAAAWAFGSIWGKHLPMPPGSMASAAQMLAAGLALTLAGFASGERLPAAPSPKSVAALAYLVLFGSFIAYSAYLYLLKTVRPALATSYAFVNPMVAMLLGSWLADEHLRHADMMALAVIVASVLLVLPFNRRADV